MAALVLVLVLPPLRALRWRYLLYPDHQKVELLGLLRLMLISQMLNILVPLRLGDLARMSTHRGLPPAQRLLGSVVAERALDAVVLLLILLLAIMIYGIPTWLEESLANTIWLTLVGLGVVAAGAWQRKRLARGVSALVERMWPKAADSIGRWLEEIGERVTVLGLRPVSVPIYGLSALIWAASIGINYIVFLALYMDLPLVAAFLLLVVLQIGVAAPSAPGKLGLFQYLCVLSLSLFGVDRAQALGYSLSLHIIAFGPPVVLGIAALWWEAKIRGSRMTLPVG
jgi:hypothetical protein